MVETNLHHHGREVAIFSKRQQILFNEQRQQATTESSREAADLDVERLHPVDAVLADQSVADDQRPMFEGPNPVHGEAGEEEPSATA